MQTMRGTFHLKTTGIAMRESFIARGTVVIKSRIEREIPHSSSAIRALIRDLLYIYFSTHDTRNEDGRSVR
jgi:hypothetical protein